MNNSQRFFAASLALSIITTMSFGGFGEVAGVLNFSMVPNSTSTQTWGIANWGGNQSLRYVIGNTTFDQNASVMPQISFSNMTGILTPDSVVYINVTVSTKNVNAGSYFSGMLFAYSESLNSTGSQGGASIRVGTYKVFHIQLEGIGTPSTSTTSTLTTTIPSDSVTSTAEYNSTGVTAQMPKSGISIVLIVGICVIIGAISVSIGAIWYVRKNRIKR